MFYRGNVVHVLVHIFISLPSFSLWWSLAFLIFSLLLQNFLCCGSSNKKCLLCFLSLALFLVKLHWRVTYFLFFSVFLFLYIPNLWTWQLIWTEYFRQHRYRNNFCFLFSSLLTLKLSLLHKTRVAMRFLAKITSSCIWVAIPVDWVISKFLLWVNYHIFLGMGLYACTRGALLLIIIIIIKLAIILILYQ